MTTAPQDSVLHRLVVGTDGTPEGHDATALASLLAGASGADVALLNVYPTSLFPIRGMTDRQTVRRLAEKSLQAERNRWDLAASVHTTTDFSIPRALSRHATRWKGDLIVVGSATSAPAGHAILSPRCRQLLGSGRFGLAIASHGLAKTQPKLRTVGVGYDGGPEAELALRIAAGVASGSGAELRLLSVVDDRLPVLSAGQWMNVTDQAMSEMWDAQREEARGRAEAAASAWTKAASVDAVCGDPARHLREFTGELDLLIIGSRRWGTLARVLAGSVGEALVADAQCSLLMVPRPHRSSRRNGHGAAARAHARGEGARPAVR